MNNLDELNKLIGEIDSELNSNSENLPDKKGYHYIEWCDYLKTVKTKLEQEKYKLVFIGQRGIGKTTTILELFGLSKREGLDGLDNKPVDLLATASGGTTTCEVELFKSNNGYTYFQIEPISDRLFNQYIDDFCASYDSDADSDDAQYLPTEISRSIRNMIGLKKPEIAAVKATCKTNDDFRNEILRRIGKENRNETLIQCQMKGGNYFQDCKDKFDKINLCKIQNVFLPAKINLYLTSDVLDFDKYPFVSSIVDTRGIDTVTNGPENSNKMKREDILNYIEKQEDKCLFFFVDGIKQAPSQNITDLLKTRMTSANAFRFFVVINIHGNEAEEVMTDDGKAESEEMGIDYKKDDILSKFRQMKIPFADTNLLFYNARKNRPERETVFFKIDTIITEQRTYIFGICEEIKAAFERAKYDFENNDYALENFDQLKALVENIKTPNDVSDRILQRFLSEIKVIHPARIAAINRYYGEYWAFNFFHEISMVIEGLFDSFFSASKDKIIAKVNEFMTYRNISELDKLNYKVFLEKFEKDYNLYRGELRDSLKERIQTSFNEEIWEDAIREYGRGTGYRERVCSIYRNAFQSFSNETNVKSEYDKEWEQVINENSLAK